MGEPCPAVVVGVDEASNKSDDDDDDVVMVQRPSVIQVVVVTLTASKKIPAPPIRWNHVEGIRQLTVQRVRRGSRLSLMVSGASRERSSIMKSLLLAQKAEGASMLFFGLTLYDSRVFTSNEQVFGEFLVRGSFKRAFFHVET